MAVYKALNSTTYISERRNEIIINTDFTNPNRSIVLSSPFTDVNISPVPIAYSYAGGSPVIYSNQMTSNLLYYTSSETNCEIVPIKDTSGTIVYGSPAASFGAILKYNNSTSTSFAASIPVAAGTLETITISSEGEYKTSEYRIESQTISQTLSSTSSYLYILRIMIPKLESDLVLSVSFTPDKEAESEATE